MKRLSNLCFVIFASLASITTPACTSSSPPLQELPDLSFDLSFEVPRPDLSMSTKTDLGDGDMSPPIGSDCKRNDDCAGLLLCDPRLGRCVDCRVSDDCAANAYCKSSHCVSATACTTDVTCKPMGQLCDLKNSRCVECNGAADCPGNDPMRLPAGTACLGHSCVPTRACMSTLECKGELVCAPGVPPRWPTDFNGKGCTECSTTGDCPSAEGCESGLCMKTCLKSGRKCGKIDDAVCGTCPGASETCSDLGIACLSDLGSFLSIDYFEDMVANKDSVFVGIRNMTSSIYKLDRATGMSRLVSLPTGYINGLSLNSTHLVFPINSKVMRLPLAGGAAEQIYMHSGTDQCYSLVADDTNFYCSLNGTSIVQVPLAGGTPIPLISPRQVDTMYVRKDKLFFGVTFSAPTGAQVGYVPVGGGTAQVLARVQASGQMFADDTYLYYSTTSGDLYRVALAGGTPESLSSMHGLFVQSLDNGLLYVSDSSGNLYRLDPKSRKIETVLTNKDSPLTKVIADGNMLFGWTGSRIRQVKVL